MARFSRPSGRLLYQASKPLEMVFYFIGGLFIASWFAPGLVGRQTGQSFVQWFSGLWSGMTGGRTSPAEPNTTPNTPKDEDGNVVEVITDVDTIKRWRLDTSSTTGLRNGPKRDRTFSVITNDPGYDLVSYARFDGGSGVGGVTTRLAADACGELLVRRQRTAQGLVGTAGLWKLPAHSNVRYFDGKDDIRTSTLEGDPRALALLMVLCTVTGQWDWSHVGIGRPGANDMHGWGAAIDWHVRSADAFNEILKPCYRDSIPVAWISVTKKGGRWPMFQIRDGKKVQVASSNQSHSSHFCFQLPRAEWVMALVPWRYI